MDSTGHYRLWLFTVVIIGAKICLIGLVILVFGRVIAQINDDASNRVWIGAIVLSGAVLMSIGGMAWIATS